jgi:hypothetical protein
MTDQTHPHSGMKCHRFCCGRSRVALESEEESTIIICAARFVLHRLEARCLQADEVGAAHSTGSLSVTIDRLSESAVALEEFAQGALSRCLAFTAGVELSELLAPLDSASGEVLSACLLGSRRLPAA